jgi:hypothetical protein
MMISPEQMDRVDQKVLEDIQRDGWSDIAVFPTADTPGLPFNYTVGLAEFNHPDLLIMGMDNSGMHEVLHSAVALIKREGSFTAGTYSPYVLKGLRVAFVDVLDPLNEEFIMSMTHRFYGEVRALQLVWPDTEDRFPWHEDFDPRFKDRQKLLGPWPGE